MSSTNPPLGRTAGVSTGAVTDSSQQAGSNSQTRRLRKRAGWRQRLVDAERGISFGIRTDSTLFAHFFVGCIIIAAGFVLRLTVNEWAMIVLALTLVVAAELFHLVLRSLSKQIGHHFDDETIRSMRMGTTAVVVAIMGASTAIIMIFSNRLSVLLGN